METEINTESRCNLQQMPSNVGGSIRCGSGKRTGVDILSVREDMQEGGDMGGPGAAIYICSRISIWDTSDRNERRVKWSSKQKTYKD